MIAKGLRDDSEKRTRPDAKVDVSGRREEVNALICLNELDGLAIATSSVTASIGMY